MGKIVKLEKVREKKLAQEAASEDEVTLAGRAKCLACEHEWVAACPAGVTILDCPKCKCPKGVFVGVAQPKDFIGWTCNVCDNHYFTLSYEHIHCIKCGQWFEYKDLLGE